MRDVKQKRRNPSSEFKARIALEEVKKGNTVQADRVGKQSVSGAVDEWKGHTLESISRDAGKDLARNRSRPSSRTLVGKSGTERPTARTSSSPARNPHQRPGLSAYNELVKIAQSYHKEPKLPLPGISIRNGHLVMGMEWVNNQVSPAAVVWVENHADYPPHRHDFHEIAIILQGLVNNVVDGKSFEAKAGDVFVLHGSHEHSFQKPKSLDILNICYDPSLLGICSRDFPDAPGIQALFQIESSTQSKGHFNNPLRLSPKQLARIETLAMEMDAEIQNAQPGYVSVMRAQLLEIIALLSRWSSGTDQKSPADTNRIAKALLWLKENSKEKLDIPHLCQICGLSRRQFFRIFSACTNQTPAEYFLNLRLRKAGELLRDPMMNITEIAFACGFTDGNHFSRTFKAFSGISPREFKQGHESTVPPQKMCLAEWRALSQG